MKLSHLPGSFDCLAILYLLPMYVLECEENGVSSLLKGESEIALLYVVFSVHIYTAEWRIIGGSVLPEHFCASLVSRLALCATLCRAPFALILNVSICKLVFSLLILSVAF